MFKQGDHFWDSKTTGFNIRCRLPGLGISFPYPFTTSFGKQVLKCVELDLLRAVIAEYVRVTDECFQRGLLMHTYRWHVSGLHRYVER